MVELILLKKGRQVNPPKILYQFRVSSPSSKESGIIGTDPIQKGMV
jgi:hypothetical protein